MEAPATYTMTGFGDVLEWRRIRFVQPMRADLICSVCDVVAADTVHLPCGHVLCSKPCGALRAPSPADPENPEFICPLDGRTFSSADPALRQVSRDSNSEDIAVACDNGGCVFSGTIGELSGHVSRCEFVEVACVKCNATVAWRDAASHCSNFALDREMSLYTSQLLAELAALREGAGLVTQAVAAMPEDGSVDSVVDAKAIKNLQSRTEDVKDKLEVVVQSTTNFHEQVLLKTRMGTILPRSRLASGRAPPPGPFRPASCRHASNLTYMLKYKKSTSTPLQGNHEELAGYGFAVEGRWSQLNQGDIEFFFNLVPATWAVFENWPFTKQINFTIPHLSDWTRDHVFPTTVVTDEDRRICPKFVSVKLGQLDWSTIDTFMHQEYLYVVVEFL